MKSMEKSAAANPHSNIAQHTLEFLVKKGVLSLCRYRHLIDLVPSLRACVRACVHACVRVCVLVACVLGCVFVCLQPLPFAFDASLVLLLLLLLPLAPPARSPRVSFGCT